MSESGSSAARRGRPPRSETQLQTSRELVIEAARHLFRTEGYDGVSMRKIAKEAGCSPSAIYAFFDSKKQILHFLWEEVFRDLVVVLRHAYDRAPPPDRVKALSLAYIDFWLGRADDFRSIFLVEDRPETAADGYFVEGSAAVPDLDIFRMAIAEAQSRGEIIARDPEELKNVLLCAFHGVTLNLLTIPEYQWGSPDRIRDTTVRLLIAGMTP